MQPIKKWSKWTKRGPHFTKTQWAQSVHLWNRLSTFISKHFLQNLKNPLVAKGTIYGRTLGPPVDSWVTFGDRATVFQQHCTEQNRHLNWCDCVFVKNDKPNSLSSIHSFFMRIFETVTLCGKCRSMPSLIQFGLLLLLFSMFSTSATITSLCSEKM